MSNKPQFLERLGMPPVLMRNSIALTMFDMRTGEPVGITIDRKAVEYVANRFRLHKSWRKCATDLSEVFDAISDEKYAFFKRYKIGNSRLLLISELDVRAFARVVDRFLALRFPAKF